jgi:hypothetical protein
MQKTYTEELRRYCRQLVDWEHNEENFGLNCTIKSATGMKCGKTDASVSIQDNCDSQIL